MGSLLKFGCFGVVGFVVLLLLAGLALGGGGRETSISGQPSNPAPKADSPQAQPKEAAKAGAQAARVGQRIESAGVALTVNSASRTDQLGPLTKAKPDRTILVVDVSLENASREKTPYNLVYFKVKDADGFEYNASLAGSDNSLKSGELPTGDRVRGVVGFDVPSTARGFVLSYQPIVILGDYQVLRVELE